MKFFVYIMTNSSKKSLYIGMTNDLGKRVYDHRRGLCKGFTERYNINQLVYYEEYQYVWDALQREKRLKHWKREWKVHLIETVNPGWEDLRSRICC